METNTETELCQQNYTTLKQSEPLQMPLNQDVITPEIRSGLHENSEKDIKRIGAKQCNDCKEIKPLIDFHFFRLKFGRCKECKEKRLKANSKKHYDKNREMNLIRDYSIEFYKTCPKCHQEKKNFEFSRNKSSKDGFNCLCKNCANFRNQIWNVNNPLIRKAIFKKHFENGGRERARERNLKNREKILKSRKERHKEKYENDIHYRLSNNMRGALHKSIKNHSVRGLLRHLPYSIEDLIKHLESLWEPWMNWENYGKYELNGPKRWSIDHIRPISSFKYELVSDEDFQICWALENLRPLEAKENSIKGSQII